MKLCVCSDSHGNIRGLQKMVEKEHPSMILFLGDGNRDLLHVDVPDHVPVLAVAGNCDLLCTLPTTRTVEVEGKRIFMTHGHQYGVKQGLSGLRTAAADAEADIVVYGHTHIAAAQQMDGRVFLCPGSIGSGGYQYLVLQLQEKNGYSWQHRKLGV